MSWRDWLHESDLKSRVYSLDARAMIRYQREAGNTIPRPLARLAEICNYPFGWGVNSRDEFGQTALHRTVRDNNPRRIARLGDKGADLHALTNANETPAELAKGLRHEECAVAITSWKPKLRKAASGEAKAPATLMLENQPE